MNGPDEEQLIEKLRKIEALYARTHHAGERMAAEAARDRLRARLAELESVEAVQEFQFSLADPWARALFVALLRRYNLRPYRYRGQRHSTVMFRVAPSFLQDVLEPEFNEFRRSLHAHLHSVTQRVIAQAIGGDDREPEERPGPATEALGAGRD